MKAATWAVPTVAITTAAPAYASSQCLPETYAAPFTLGKYDQATGKGTATTPNGATLSYTVTTSTTGNIIIQAPNLSVYAPPTGFFNGLGDLREDGLQLQQKGGTGRYSDRQSVTVTFAQPVTNLTLTIADLDRTGGTSGTGAYKDAVTITPSPSFVRHGSTIGAGTATSPITTTGTSAVNSDTPSARATITLAGPLTSFTLDFWSLTGSLAQQIFLTGMTLESETC